MLVELNGSSGHGESFAPIRLRTADRAGEIAVCTIAALENGALIAQSASHE